MEETAVGRVVDLLAFALLVAVAILLLGTASPVDPEVESTRYATCLARSALLSIHNSTADQFGGFCYSPAAAGLVPALPVIGDSLRVELRHKTIAQLLAEDALLNLRVEVCGADLRALTPNEDMDEELRLLLGSVLKRAIGGRCAYRLRAGAKPIDLGFVRVHFEMEVADLAMARTRLCSESAVLSLPVSGEDLVRRLENALGVDLPATLGEIDPTIEVNLELWAR